MFRKNEPELTLMTWRIYDNTLYSTYKHALCVYFLYITNTLVTSRSWNAL